MPSCWHHCSEAESANHSHALLCLFVFFLVWASHPHVTHHMAVFRWLKKKSSQLSGEKGNEGEKEKKIWFTLPLVFVQLVGKKEKRRKRERKTRRGWRVESQRLLCIRVMKRVEAAEPLHVQNRWLLSDKHVPISLANKITFYLILSAENQSENWVSNSPLGTV